MVAVPLGVVTEIFPVRAPVGIRNVILVEPDTVNGAATPPATPSIDCNTALRHRLVCSNFRRSHPAFTRDIARALGEAVPPTLTTTHYCPPNRRRNEEPDEKQDTCASISRSGSKQMYAKIQHLNDGMAKSSSRLSKFAENFFILSRSVD